MTHYLVRRGFPMPQLCKDCDEAPAVEFSNIDAPACVADDYLCEPCAERRWDREQERRMEDGV